MSRTQVGDLGSWCPCKEGLCRTTENRELMDQNSASRGSRLDFLHRQDIRSLTEWQVYFDLLVLSRQIPNTGGRRLVWTIYHAVLDFLALKVLYSCITDVNTIPVWLESTMTDLLSISHKAINEDSEHVYRYAWSLHMALFKVRDPIHRDWLQSQVRKASILLSNLGIPSAPTHGLGSHDRLFTEPNTPVDMQSQPFSPA